MVGLTYVVRSLLFTSFISFAIPLVSIGGVLLVLLIMAQITSLYSISEFSLIQLTQFLNVLGNGDRLEGLLIIGLASGLVGSLFDAFNLLRYPGLRHY